MNEETQYHSLTPLFDELRGKRVLVRPYQPQDAEALFEAVDESRLEFDPWIRFGLRQKTLEQSRDWINRMIARWTLREELAVGIWELATGRLLGDSNLRPLDWEVPSFNLGYWLRTSATGQGFMTEAAQLLVDFAFTSLQANRIEISCDEENKASAAVARRLGFEQEARLRNHRRGTDKTLRNMLVFSRIPQ
jgi:RimJ/RimL family protein N-acetyltransferase